jgi:hypothetical protein
VLEGDIDMDFRQYVKLARPYCTENTLNHYDTYGLTKGHFNKLTDEQKAFLLGEVSQVISNRRTAVEIPFEASVSFIVVWLFKCLVESGSVVFEYSDEEIDVELCGNLTLSEPTNFELCVDFDVRSDKVFYTITAELTAEEKQKRGLPSSFEEMFLKGKIKTFEAQGSISPETFEDDIEDFLIDRRKVTYSLLGEYA